MANGNSSSASSGDGECCVECGIRLFVDCDDRRLLNNQLLRSEEHLGRAQHEDIVAAIQSIAQNYLNQLTDEHLGKVNVAPDNRKIGRFQTIVLYEMIAPSDHHLPVLACIGVRYRGNPRGGDWLSRFT